MCKADTMLSYTPIEEAWRRSPLPVRRMYPRDTMKHIEPIAQISNDFPEQVTGPESGSEYHRLEDNRSDNNKSNDNDNQYKDNRSNDLKDNSQEDLASAATTNNVLHHQQGQQYLNRDEDTSLYDVILFGIAGVVVVMILEQFVQMGIALQKPRIT